MTGLFDPFALKSVTLRNRVVIAPMCQYSADDGLIGDWQLVHLGARAIGGAGLIIAEATAVAPEGRITPKCAGLWHDGQVAPWQRVTSFIKAHGAAAGIQLAHAGRKASTSPPWVNGGASLDPADPAAWQPIGPSAVAFGGNIPTVPTAMTADDIARVAADFAAAARRAEAAGFDWLELHFAHGYLGASFLSPLANKRTDEYGGDLAGRQRFLVECAEAVRAVWPAHLPLTAKLGVDDFTPGGITLEDGIATAKALAAAGIDLIDVSLGVNSPDMSGVPFGPGFLVPHAARVRAEAGVPVGAGWSITDGPQADAILRKDKADLIHIAHASLADPQWPYHAAQALGVAAPNALLPIEVGSWLKPRG